MKQLLALYHLTSAAHNARIAGELEDEFSGNKEEVYRGESFKRWQPIHDAHITTCIMTAFAGVEAGINEFWDEPPWKAESNIERVRWFSSEFSDNFRSWGLSTLNKYELALDCAGTEGFDQGEEPYQSVELLRRTRNYVTHYNPEWFDLDNDEKHRIAQGLETKNIKLNPFRQTSSGAVIPFDYFSYECGVWAVKTAFEFIDEFYSVLEAKHPYGDMDEVILRELETGWKDTCPEF